MISKSFVSCAALALASFLVTPAAHAQSDMHFKVPFAYFANGKVLPAGEYVVQADLVAHVVQLRSKDAPVGLASLVQPTEGHSIREVGILAFHRIGDTYFLSTVWFPGDRVGLAFPKSRNERELIAKHHGVRQSVTLAALR